MSWTVYSEKLVGSGLSKIVASGLQIFLFTPWHANVVDSFDINGKTHCAFIGWMSFGHSTCRQAAFMVSAAVGEDDASSWGGESHGRILMQRSSEADHQSLSTIVFSFGKFKARKLTLLVQVLGCRLLHPRTSMLALRPWTARLRLHTRLNMTMRSTDGS